MATKMLIDATHTEETRVAVVNDELLEEFDFETSTKKQNKGNIYLAKVTRVEPSLQAAFVDYGGDRQGFLAFSEIHPDYYQIPIDDRRAVIAAQKAAAEIDSDADDEIGVGQTDEAGTSAVGEEGGTSVDDAANEAKRPTRATKHYRIQEVIKRRQILLVQVNKEERGTKGAALTTYISLPGRYCVLMPNTARGGGVSRKIESGETRRRLRSVVGELNVPDGMAVIVRTAGQERNKAEIKRDFDYLLRLWESVRESTLKSIAPSLIYEEANLIKRSIRDLYRSEFSGILVQGEDGYRTAKAFMRMMMPSRAKLVQPYRNEVSLFHQYKIEDQLDLMHSPVVRLSSGGYLVINVTEALVAVDVNSGSATRERSIEETAVKTNLEAAEEIARQLKLRDLAGLIVVDFIDMEENRNNRSVERRLRDSFALDRARTQMGRISTFGLMEFTRQRLRPSLLEASSHICPHCIGSGRVRSSESLVMQALRAIEQAGLDGGAGDVTVSLPPEAAMYLLNNKRQSLHDIESRYEMQLRVIGETVVGPVEVRVDRVTPERAPETTTKTAAPRKTTTPRKNEKSTRSRRPERRAKHRDDSSEESRQDVVEEVEATVSAGSEKVEKQGDVSDGTDNVPRSRSRRRGRRGGRRRGPRAREAGSSGTVAGTNNEQVVGQEKEPTEHSKEKSAGAHPQSGITPDDQLVPQKQTNRIRTSAKTEPSEVVMSPEIGEKGAEKSKHKPQGEEVNVETTSSAEKKTASRSGSRVTRVRRRTATTRKTNSETNGRRSRRVPAPSDDGEALLTETKEATAEAAISEGKTGRSRRAPKGRRQRTSPKRRTQKLAVDTTGSEVTASSADEESSRTTMTSGSPKNVNSGSDEQTAESKDQSEKIPTASRRKGWWQRVTGS